MRADTRRHCRSCLVCVSRRGANRIPHPPLQPIPVGGRVGVDVLQLPLTEAGNRYVVVFQDYLTKWVEAFATPNQTAETIAHLLVNEIFCRHGAPEHLLSDRGANFLSELVQDVCKLLSIKKINTSGYHPQTDGLVEKFNSTLINMISKVAQSSGRDWDRHLPYLLFAYRASVHGPYRVLSVTPTNVEARLVDHPDADPIFVAVSRVRPCYPELSNLTWTGSAAHAWNYYLSDQSFAKRWQ